MLHLRSDRDGRTSARAPPRPPPAVAGPPEGRAYFAAAMGTGRGLVADYYADANLTNLALARTEAAVNFSWAGSPGAGVPADRFSARWTGQVLAPFSETY